MFQNLSEKLESAFKNIKGQGRITDLNIANTIKDIRRALVDADVPGCVLRWGAKANVVVRGGRICGRLYAVGGPGEQICGTCCDGKRTGARSGHMGHRGGCVRGVRRRSQGKAGEG